MGRFTSVLNRLDITAPRKRSRREPGRTKRLALGWRRCLLEVLEVRTLLSVGGAADEHWLADGDAGDLGGHTQGSPEKKWFEKDNVLPPLNGMYSSTGAWFAVYQNGIIVRSVSDRAFSQAVVTPPDGSEVTHTFGSQVEMDISTDGGASFQQFAATAASTMRTYNAGPSDEDTLYPEEMLDLTIAGGELPSGVMIRESPTKASSGQGRRRRLAVARSQVPIACGNLLPRPH